MRNWFMQKGSDNKEKIDYAKKKNLTFKNRNWIVQSGMK
jgi:hypothetical protein